MARALHSCSYCSDFVAPTTKRLLRHVKLVHSQEPGFKIRCSYPHCSRNFSNYRTYQNHLIRHCRQRLTREYPNEVSGNEEGRTEEHGEPNEEVQPDTTALTENIANDVRNFCAKWILKTSELRKLTRKASLGIVEDVSGLIRQICSILHQQVSRHLLRNNISITDDLMDIFSESNDVITPFRSLTTFHQQLNFYKENFNLIMPRKEIISEKRFLFTTCGGKHKVKVQREEVFYVPIIDTLKQMLQNKTILKEVMMSHVSDNDSIMADFCDGTHFKSHSLFSVDQSTLHLHLYYDELEL
ncbi:PREDICTED: uncharacterized protein LOC109591385, partial [Amphimedon queenslandica]|uniref:C2H2-type domain-containing protein n=2 Tax=Amphimedon queenslandica TaxID=400682 RepID=A0AAN0JZY5_AMPQE